MHMTKTLIGVLALALLVAVGCDSGGDDDGDAMVAGRYEATTLEATGVSLLGFGGDLEATLNADGTVQGRLIVPEELASQAGDVEGDVTVDFDGTYTVAGNTVRFDVEPASNSDDFDASFIRDVEWMFSNGTLRTEVDATDQLRLTVVLTRQN